LIDFETPVLRPFVWLEVQKEIFWPFHRGRKSSLATSCS
jgi:hypothetical protein